MRRWCVLFLISIFLSFTFSSAALSQGSGYKSKMKIAMEYKADLSFRGIQYSPWEDRLENDLVLMRTLLGFDHYPENRFGDYQIISTKGKTFVNKRKKLVFVNYRSSPTELKDLLFGNKYIKYVPPKKKKKLPKLKQKPKKSTGGKLQVDTVQGGVVNSITPVAKPKAKSNPYLPYGIDLKSH